MGHMGLAQGTMAAADIPTTKVGYNSVDNGYWMRFRTSRAFSILGQSRPFHIACCSLYGIISGYVLLVAEFAVHHNSQDLGVLCWLDDVSLDREWGL